MAKAPVKSEYAWSDSKMACVATYKILEGDKFMNEFEDSDIPFEKASDVEMSSLFYWPQTTGNDALLKLAASQAAKKFWYLLIKNYTVLKEEAAKESYKMLDDVEAVFASKDATLKKLAEVVDKSLKFPNE
ncbi:hypothetical protein ACN2C7_15805 [Caulobacter sp. ErkDOM-E]|uniref:hypothetical protein n=1 Tax=Caulobacter sp. ErkDOM-E TaxID=3402778 RepID=UPI003AF4F384